MTVKKHLAPWAATLCLAFAAAGPARAVPLDADGDGVPDGADQLPCDASAAAVSFYPSETETALLAFEDQWPGATDLDFNDVVVAVHQRIEQTASGRATRVLLTVQPVAIGGVLDNGLGFHLPIDRAGVTVRRRVDGGAWQAVPLEGDAQATARVSANLRELFAGAAGHINADGATTEGQRLEVEVTFASPAQLSAAAAPFDLFLFRSGDAGHEIHFPDQDGTAALHPWLFGSSEDGSTEDRKFVHVSGIPAALNLGLGSRYPVEGTDISAVFPDIVAFAQSSGAQHADFYATNVNTALSIPVARRTVAAVAVDNSCVSRFGSNPGQPGRSCRDILAQNPATQGHDGLYYLDQGGGTYTAWCDMTTDGGGWTLVMQASSQSAYGYAHAVWTNTSAPNANTTDVRLDQDQVSPAFYGLAAGESRLCLGDLAHCAAWRHLRGTARDLSNGLRTTTVRGWAERCTTPFCGPNSLPEALVSATPGTRAAAYHRFGYVNDVNPWGTRTRVGATADNDDSDSSDTTLGLGLECTGTCAGTNLGSVTGPAHGRGAGYYKYSGWSTAPHDGALQAFLFVRDPAPTVTRNDASSTYRDCEALRAAGASLGDGVYWIRPNGVDAVRAYCDMTTHGGGWTLVMQASSQSAYTYAHAVWTQTAVPAADNLTDPAVDTDQVSTAFYGLAATESMLCMGNLANCASWTHANNTARNLANGARMASAQGNGGFCGSWECPANTVPNALVAATAGTTAATWHRFGYVNDDNAFGTRTRVGTTADNDASDSSDTIIGIGLDCFANCPANMTTDGVHGRGSGYYKYASWSVAPHDDATRGFLFVRTLSAPTARNAAAGAPVSCRAIQQAGGSQGDGVYWITVGGAPTLAFCDMTTDGGGWTLVMQASTRSAYGYAHGVWSAASAATGAWTDLSRDLDRVSPAFYATAATDSMLCMGDRAHCSAWTHASGTPRNLANGARMTSAQGNSTFCGTFRCAANTVPTALVGATPGTTAATWHRFGYVNDSNAWGTRTRVGTTADNDASDSSDTVIGLGLECTAQCRINSLTGPAHDTGSGYYKYSSWSIAPHDGALRSYLFTR